MEIVIKGARVHNLKNIDLTLPHGKLIVITGLSGSGKSTLAFDTIFAEGQRRYVESLSSYARQFLGKIDKPDIDMIEGIAPAIAVEQKVRTRNPRSTVGTSTEIYDYLKLLFARIGKVYSPVSGKEVRSDSVDDVIGFITSLPAGTKLMVASRTRIPKEQSITEYLTVLMSNGFARIITPDGNVHQIEDFIKDAHGEFSILIDRLAIPEKIDREFTGRVFDSVQKAFSVGEKHAQVWIFGQEMVLHEFSTAFEADGIEFEKPSEHLFSFNNPIGACPKCEGYGKIMGIDEDLVIPDKSKTIYENAVACWRGDVMGKWKDQLVYAGEKSGIPIHKPFYQFTAEEKLLLWSGNEYFKGLNDFFEMLQKNRFKGIQYRVMLTRYTGKSTCPLCQGTRLKQSALLVKVAGHTIADLQLMSIDKLVDFFTNLSLDAHDSKVAERILKEIRVRLSYLQEVGLGYLTLGRMSSTLSGGESQRINLASSLGSSLVGSLYILDEPSIGLHPRDSENLINVLKKLRDIGNTVLVVEHDRQIMENADWIVDVGPLAGSEGGEIVYSGPLKGMKNAMDRSLTAQYLFGNLHLDVKSKVRKWNRSITIKGARENNLKNIDVEIPLGIMTCITGVSGSGKSSLVDQILYPTLLRTISETTMRPGDSDGIVGDTGTISDVELIDQNPIGKSTRSNAVTYLKIYDKIRALYASQQLAKVRGIAANSFSFNSPGGRCEECKGEGIIHIQMQFMSDIDIVCEKCHGKRFTDEVLEILYKEKTIYDILEMTVDDAVQFFAEDKDNRTCQSIVSDLEVLRKVGLGYIKLGQTSATLSGGENQRIKLAYYLLQDKKQKMVFIFDEPTTGLHFHDTEKLLESLEQLVDRGHTVVVVEHNMDVVRSADWLIDLGPEGGENGGRVVYAGIPEKIVECKESITGKYF